MNSLLITASLLTVAIAAAHSYLGERYILIRLFKRSNLPHLFGSDVFTKQTLRFAWHITTVAWLGTAAVLLVIASRTADPLAALVGRVIAVMFLASSLLALFGSRGKHLSWIVFLAIAIMTWLGLRQ